MITATLSTDEYVSHCSYTGGQSLSPGHCLEISTNLTALIPWVSNEHWDSLQKKSVVITVTMYSDQYISHSSDTVDQ